jgi:CubicO group peptidase (beta-lactamase class C family)
MQTQGWPTKPVLHFNRAVLALILVATVCGCSRKADDRFLGDWAATSDSGSISQRLILHLRRDSDGRLTGSTDNVDQGIRNVPCDHITLKGNDLSFTSRFGSQLSTFTGKLSADGRTLSGISSWKDTATAATARRQLFDLGSGTAPIVFKYEGKLGVNVEPSAVDGDWVGILDSKDLSGMLHKLGQLHRLGLHVRTVAPRQLSVTLDFLDWGGDMSGTSPLMAIPCSDSKLEGRIISFDIEPWYVNYQGVLSKDNKTLTGTWYLGAPVPDNNRALLYGHDTVKFIRNGNSQARGMTATLPAVPPVALADLKPVLDREFAPVLDHGVLFNGGGGGLVIGVLDHGQRRIFAYGTARPDSLLEIDSVTKTFTGLLLAQMVVQGRVNLNTPLRELLPPGVVAKPNGPEITLLDLVTQHSGLPEFPPYINVVFGANPRENWDLSKTLAATGIAKPKGAKFLYSSFGFGVLGYALALRAGLSYEQLLQSEITGPLHLKDTVVTLSPDQHHRLIQGHTAAFEPEGSWEFDALGVGMAGLRSTAGDLLTYLQANLHPETLAVGAAPGSPSATLPAALMLDHRLHGDGPGMAKVAFAWWYSEQAGVYHHDGGAADYTAHVEFNPTKDRAIVVLYNRYEMTPGQIPLVHRVAENVDALMSGKPPIALDYLSDIDRATLAYAGLRVR